MVEVAGLVGGESRELTIRLPGTAMRLASAAGRATAFTDLFVAVDIDNVVAEVDKTNNVAILERTLLEEEAQ
jgi:subtilase family serine protease